MQTKKEALKKKRNIGASEKSERGVPKGSSPSNGGGGEDFRGGKTNWYSCTERNKRNQNIFGGFWGGGGKSAKRKLSPERKESTAGPKREPEKS